MSGSNNSDGCIGCFVLIIAIVAIAKLIDFVTPYVKTALTYAPQVSLCLLALSVVGCTIGILVAVYNFLYAIIRTIRAEKKPYYFSSETTRVLARVNYFYWKGAWKDDFKKIVTTFCKRNVAHASGAWKMGWKFVRSWLLIPLSPFLFLLAIFIWIGAIVIIPTLTLSMAIIMISALIYIFIVATELSIIERIYLRIMRMHHLCPVCHRPPLARTPTYRCPKCNNLHHNLVPSVRYGAFYRVCVCNTHLPTSRFFGRMKLPAICSHMDCRADFDTNAENTALQTIAFVGAPSVGKTSILYALISDMRTRALPAYGWSTSMPSAYDKNWAEQMEHDMATGAVCYSTRDLERALCMDAHKLLSTTMRLYFYDPPGEDFSSVDRISQRLYYNHLKVALFIIDPFTIPELCQDAKSRGFSPQTVSGNIMTDESLERWLISIERDFRTALKHTVCAVLINKTDDPCLKEISGLESGASQAECEAFIERYNMSHTLDMIKRKFAAYSIHAVAARPNLSRGVVKPRGFESVSDWIIHQLKLH